MHIDETKRVLARIALIDNRTADRAVLEAWHETIGHLHYPDALRAVTLHHQRSTDWIQPAHIIRLAVEAKRERDTAEARERATRALPPPPPKPIPAHIKAMFNTIGKEPAPTLPYGAQDRTPQGPRQTPRNATGGPVPHVGSAGAGEGARRAGEQVL